MFKDYLLLDSYQESIIKIIDDDFELIVKKPNSKNTIYPIKIAAATSVIDVYNYKSLNVAKNLFLFMLRVSEVNFSLTPKFQANLYKQFIPEYQQFHSEIEKYLLLK
jgi:hypothetical protein